MSTSSKKTEKRAITYIESMLNSIDFLDYEIKSEDTGVSWDGYIDLLKSSDIEKKENFIDRLPIQVKGRTHYSKKFQRKIKFDIDISDLKNYKKLDGTILFVIKIKEDLSYKIYYKSLLPSNITKILEENKANTNQQIKIQLMEVKDIKHLESICVDFHTDKQIQKKLSDEIFNNQHLSMNGNTVATFNHYYGNNMQNMYDLIGEEKNIYIKSNEDIVGVECLEIEKIGRIVNLNIGFDKKEGYYKTYRVEKDINNNDYIEFGKSFILNMTTKKVNINIKGSLNERIKDLKFICKLSEKNYFYINTIKIGIKFKDEKIEQYKNMLKDLEKIKEFCEHLRIKKDIQLDNWNEEDYRKLHVWIYGIMNRKTINAPNWKTNMIGNVCIRDLTFSAITQRDNGNNFFIRTVWDNSVSEEGAYIYENGKIKIYTNNLFSILNREVYICDDIDIPQMINKFNSYKLNDGEEGLLNLQALEVITAYDTSKNKELLDYAEFLLNKIEKFDDMKEVAIINLMQIKKRKKGILEDEDISKVMEIRKNKSEDDMYLLSVATLMENKTEAEYILKNMLKTERQEFENFPIYTLTKELLKE